MDGTGARGCDRNHRLDLEMRDEFLFFFPWSLVGNKSVIILLVQILKIMSQQTNFEN